MYINRSFLTGKFRHSTLHINFRNILSMKLKNIFNYVDFYDQLFGSTSNNNLYHFNHKCGILKNDFLNVHLLFKEYSLDISAFYEQNYGLGVDELYKYGLQDKNI